MDINLSELSPLQVYHTMTQTIVPRPIAWVLTENENKSLNLAPFSYFCGVCSDPPIILLSLGKRPGGTLKDTLVNIRDRKSFVLHIPSQGSANEVSESSRGLPPGESEIDSRGLDTVSLKDSSLPRLAECKIAYSGELHEIQEMGNGPQFLIFGRLKSVYLADEIVRIKENGRLKVDAEKVDILSRLGGDEYSIQGKIRTVPRPTQ